MNLHAAVVLDEAQFTEVVQKETDSGAGGADHLGQRLLADLGDHELCLALLTEVGRQEQQASQSLLPGIKKLVHQILFDANVPRENVAQKQVCKFRLFEEAA